MPTDQPSIQVYARVTARRLRFERTPHAEATFLETGHKTEDRKQHRRHNLPEKVAPAQIYRDVDVCVEYTTLLKARKGG
jgi:hypothetical protein